MGEHTFITGELNELDMHLINILLMQSRVDERAVIRACEFVLNKLKENNE